MDRRCVHHDAAPAIAICSMCRGDICASCHRPTLTGYAVCRPCQEAVLARHRTAWENASGLALVHGFLHTAVEILSGPRSFFGRRPAIGSSTGREWVRPVVFGLLCIGIGTYAATTWQALFVGRFQELMGEFAVEAQIPEAYALPVMFLSIPILVPLRLALHVVLLRLSLRMVGAEPTWPGVARIAGYASAAFLFQIIPPIYEFSLGHLLAVVWLFNLEVTGVRVTYGLTFWKSLAAVMLPFFAVMMFGL